MTHQLLICRFLLAAGALVMAAGSNALAEDCNWNWVDDAEDIAQGTSEDCNSNAVPDECDSAPEPFTSTSGWLMPIGGSTPKTFTVAAARPAAGDVTLSLAVSADLGGADKSIAVSLRGFGPIGTVIGTTSCPLIPEVTEFVVTRWGYNYAVSTGDVIFDLVPTEAVDAGACGGNPYLSATVNYDVAALPDCNENDMLDECDIAQGTSADVNTNGQPDECESVQGGCIRFRTVPVQPYPGGTPYPPGTILDQDNESITFPPGGPYRVWLELRISNWACTGHAMGTWQATYGPDFRLPPGITRPPQPCVTSNDCHAAGMGCAPPGCAAVCNAGNCDAGWEQQMAEQPTALGFDIEACMTTNIACGGTQVASPPIVDNGTERYAMTVVLDVQPSFSGVAILDVQNVNSDTFFQDEDGQQIPIGQVIPATIGRDPRPCCRPNGSCVSMFSVDCQAAGGTFVNECLGDCDGNLFDDACEFVDCNDNGQHDPCDIVFGDSTDCELNGIPDDCETSDCNGNSEHDSCDFAYGNAFDCNANRLPDDCDISSGSSVDADNDDVPDECENIPMSRYLAFNPKDVITGATNHAARITLVSLAGFPQFAGEHRWLGAPPLFPDGSGPALEIYKFPAARVDCDSVFVNWTTYPRYFAYGSAVLPESQYAIRFGDEACVLSGKEACLSPPIIVNTGRWGDIIAPFGGLSQPNFSDIRAETDKFSQLVGAPIKPRSQLRNNETDPSVRVNFSDIALCVDAFRGFVYPYAGPSACSAERQLNR